MRFPIFKTTNFSVLPTNDAALFEIYYTKTASSNTEPVMEHRLSKQDAVNVASALQIAFERGTDRGRKLQAIKTVNALGLAEALRG